MWIFISAARVKKAFKVYESGTKFYIARLYFHDLKESNNVTDFKSIHLHVSRVFHLELVIFPNKCHNL